MTVTTGATIVIILLGIVVLAAGYFIGESQGIKEGIEIGMNVAGYVRNLLTEEEADMVGPFTGDGEEEGEENAESMGD